MTKEQIAIKRQNRGKKRQLKQLLKAQAAITKNETPIGKYINLDMSFDEFAVKETSRELKNGCFEPDREALIEKIINLKNKLNPKKGV